MKILYFLIFPFSPFIKSFLQSLKLLFELCRTPKSIEKLENFHEKYIFLYKDLIPLRLSPNHFPSIRLGAGTKC